MGLTSVLLFLVLIGTSMQAPRPQSIDDDNDDQENKQVNQDEIASSLASSSMNKDDQDQNEFTRDEPEENTESYNEKDDDSVDSFIKKNIVSKPQAIKSAKQDSVASYISLKDQGDGVGRHKIPKKYEVDDGDDDDDDDDHENGSSEKNDEPLGLNVDSVASYINPNSGVSRNQIPAKSGNDEDEGENDEIKDTPKRLNSDSVASYINQQPQETGETKDTITEKPLEEDSVASYISIATGSLRHKIPQTKDENEPIASNTLESKDQSKPDSVSSYINLVDKDTQESSTSDGSGEELQDEEDNKSQKTDEIFEGLENVSTEKKKKFKNQRMNDLNPDMIIPHQMIGELWVDRSYASPATPLKSTPYADQILNSLPYHQPQYTYVNVSKAESKGAVCLDGSTPGFFYRQGVQSGAKKWIIYLQGGAWCHSEMDCYYRSQSNLGSSLLFNKLVNVEGLLSRDSIANPNFYNWNVVYVPYCDGGSYTGNRTKPIEVEGRKIYFRGKRILSGLLDDLLGYGMNDAEKVIFSGTSAGGLSVLLHTDYVRSRIPSKVDVYSLSDAGIFLNAANLKKQKKFSSMMSDVFKLHRSSSCVNHKCKKHEGKANAWKCMFPQYFGKYIKSHVFIVNPLYDSWQLGNVIGISCTKNLHKCSSKEMKAVINFRKQTLEALEPLMKNPHISLFADGCFDHGQIIFGPKWNDIRVKNRSMSGTFSRWMMKEERLKDVVDPDSDELFNPTCVVHQVTISKKSLTNS